MQMKTICNKKPRVTGVAWQSAIAIDYQFTTLTPMVAEYETSELEKALRAAGARMTKPRKVIIRILAEKGDQHPDAMDIFRRAVREDSRISLPTVYRTLKMLEEHGAIQRHAFADGRSRYEPADGPHHDHLIDMDTGDVIEFQSEKIEQLQEEIAHRLGYEIVHHRLELYGRKRKTGS
jgi:Fur family ferric uptake transcriptional regulator